MGIEAGKDWNFMEDFIFGTMATDELKLVHHRAARQGWQHAHDLSPADPLPGQAVTVRARAGVDQTVTDAALYYTTDGRAPQGSRGQASVGQAVPLRRVAVEWDTLAWGYVAVWEASLPPQPEGAVIRYRIGAWSNEGEEIFADWPDPQWRAEQAASAHFRQQPLPAPRADDPPGAQTFTLHVDRLAPPGWAREAVIYQIFVDRFYPGDGRGWLQTDNLTGFCGGTLWGVRDKLDYIEALGANCLWLTPIFPSPTPHGYDATDFTTVDPRYGGEEALRALVEAAHARGMRVLLDYACSHVSSAHPFFVDARRDPASPYRDWFHFDESETGYRAFFGVATMPTLNVAHPDVRAHLIDVARTWLRAFDVDGYRLDYASGPGPDFWADFWAACKAEKPDALCLGEVVDAPDAQRRYAGRLDGCMDFHLADALRKTFGWGRWSEADLERFVERHLAYFPPNFVLPSFLDNHDMDRFLFIAGGDVAALRRAAAFQMRLPGPPIIYYGTEVGMSQDSSRHDGWGLEVSRAPMVWGARQDTDLLAFYRGLIRERRAARLSP